MSLDSGIPGSPKGTQAREAIDAFILGLVRFQVGCCARFDDLQHTSPVTLRVTTSTIEMMAWQTTAFRISAVDRTQAYPVRGGLVDRLGGYTSELAFLRTFSGYRLFDPNSEQRFPGGHSPSGCAGMLAARNRTIGVSVIRPTNGKGD